MTIILTSQENKDLESYRSKLIIPSGKLDEIRTFLTDKEKELNSIDPDCCGDFYPFFKWFLVTCSYTQNILNPKHDVSNRTLDTMEEFAEYLEFDNPWFYGIANESMYYFEKLVRLGFKGRLKESDVQKILETEKKYIKDHDIGTYIKMLSRHKMLEIPLDLDPKKKHELEGYLDFNYTYHSNDPNKNYHFSNLGFLAAGKRAGLNISKIREEDLEYWINIGLEHNNKVEVARQLTRRERTREETRLKLTNEQKFLELYIFTMHHLKRVFGEDD